MTLERGTPTRASRAPAGCYRSRSEKYWRIRPPPPLDGFAHFSRIAKFKVDGNGSLVFTPRQRLASQHSMLLAARRRRPLKNVQGCGRGRENSGFDAQKRGAPGRGCQSSHWLAIQLVSLGPYSE